MVLLALLFVLVPLAELFVIVQVGNQLGFLTTFGLLLLFSILGGWLARRQGLAAWRRFQRALAEGRMPAAEVADGAMVLLAGALLLTPGFLTDVVGLLLLVPAVRAGVRRVFPVLALRRWVRRRHRMVVFNGASRTNVRWGHTEIDDPRR